MKDFDDEQLHAVFLIPQCFFLFLGGKGGPVKNIQY